MPVVRINFDRFIRMVGVKREEILQRLPFLGLDIEGIDEKSVRVEYNPNRPDFSTDYGLARALKGLLEIEMGVPSFKVKNGNIKVNVNKNLSNVRPFIACAVAKGLALDDETIRQMISMQEDLHNGIGRRRKKVAIGLHNLDVISPPIFYEGREPGFAFTPLGSREEMVLRDILTRTETGITYGPALAEFDLYPILRDAAGNVLSFPPIINGEKTRVDTSTRNLFIDVTSTEEKAGHDALAIVATAIADAGAKLEDVQILYPGGVHRTPDLRPEIVRFDAGLVQKTIGLDLSHSLLRRCLRRSRLDLASRTNVAIPRYRVDILHPVDIAEEVAIGYGIDRLEPLYPGSRQPGSLQPFNESLEKLSEVVVQSGFVETVNYELVDVKTSYENFERSSEGRVEVENPRSLEHSLLRDSLIPSLMSDLARNVKEEYPQKIFEVGKVYVRHGSVIVEKTHLAAIITSASTSFTDANMYLAAIFQTYFGVGIRTRPSPYWPFTQGRCARVEFGGISVGHVGELKASAIVSFGIQTPVSGFEVDLTSLLSSRHN